MINPTEKIKEIEKERSEACGKYPSKVKLCDEKIKIYTEWEEREADILERIDELKEYIKECEEGRI